MDRSDQSSDAQPAGNPVPKRPRYAWRISLRTLMIATTGLSVLLGFVVAPVAWELNRAVEVSRTTQVLQSGGAYVVYRSRPDSRGLWLAQKLQLQGFSYLGKEIYRVDCGDRHWDLAKIPVIDTLEEIHFRHRDVTCSDPSYRQPSVRLVHFQNFSPANPAAQKRNPRLLLHFPNVEKARLLSVKTDSAILQDLSACPRLSRLELSLYAGGNLNGSEEEPAPWDGKPVRDLKQLKVLHADCTWMPVDWSFLQTMPELREVRATGCHVVWADTAAHRPRTRYEARQRTPLYYLAQLPNLHWLSIRHAESYTEDLNQLAKTTQIRKLKLDALPDGAASLAALREAKNLRSLHLEFKTLKNDLPAVAEELKGLKQVRELNASFHEFTPAHVDLLAQQSHIENFNIVMVREFKVREGDLEKLFSIPVRSFPNHSYLRNGDKLRSRAGVSQPSY